MSFRDTLTNITNRIEDCAAIVILGIDGLPIERLVKDIDPSIDIDTTAIEFTTLIRRGVRTALDAQLGDLSEIVLTTDKMTFLLRPITTEYFLLMALNPGGNVGRARFELRKAQLLMAAEFAI